MAQIFCDSLFQSTALSTPTKTSQSGDDNPRHPSDAQREQQIEDCFGQMTQNLPIPGTKQSRNRFQAVVKTPPMGAVLLKSL
jgi:hypothetical protein